MLTIIGIVVVAAILLGGLIYAMRGQEEADVVNPVIDPNSTPTVTVSPQPEDEQATEDGENIEVTSPDPEDEVSLPLIISGIARVFENQLQYRVTDGTGAVVAEGIATATAPDVGQFGPFLVTINEWDEEPAATTGMVEVFSSSPLNGSEINKVTIPITFEE